MTRNTTVGLKINSFTIFVPAAFYLISWCCCSKQKSRGEFQTSHDAKTSLFTTAMAINTESRYLSFLTNVRTEMSALFFIARNLIKLDNVT
jgi:hypothetical protein